MDMQVKAEAPSLKKAYEVLAKFRYYSDGKHVSMGPAEKDFQEALATMRWYLGLEEVTDGAAAS